MVAPLTPLTFNARFCLSFPEVTTLTIGAKHPEEFAEHLLVADEDGPLGSEEQTIVEGLERRSAEALATERCTQCYACLPCPEDIHIPEILRLRNMTVAYDMEPFGQYRYKMFENASHWFPGKKATRCTDCGDCLPRCPEHLDIPKLIRQTHDRLVTVDGKRQWTGE